MQNLSNTQIFLKYAFILTDDFFPCFPCKNKSSTFFMPMELYTLKNKNIQMHKNPYSIDNNVKYRLIFST